MKVFTCFVFLTSALGVFANTPTQVMADIESISACIIKLNDDVNAITNWDLPGAWAIHTAARTLVTTLDVATINAKEATMNAISLDDIQTALTATKNLGNIIVKAMDDLIEKNDVIKAMPVSGAGTLVCQDLGVLKMSALAYQTAMLAGIPNEMKGVANGIIGMVNDAMDIAISVYT